jgi:membrane protein insertase Oxa1/YidC/SpoIIIJ
MKKQNKTTTIMVVVFVIMGLTVPTLLGLYWMYSGMFTITQNLWQHYRAQKRARMHGIQKDIPEWKERLNQKAEAFKNAKVWDIAIYDPTKK